MRSLKLDPLKTTVFAADQYKYLAPKLLEKRKNLIIGDLQRAPFEGDGEIHRQFENLDQVEGRDLVYIQHTHLDQALMDVLFFACAAQHWSANSLTLLIPYFGYSTMERAVTEGDFVTGWYASQLIGRVPKPVGGLRTCLFDLHVSGQENQFPPEASPRHVYLEALHKKAILEITPDLTDVYLLSPDAGRVKWTEAMAKTLNMQTNTAFKRRYAGGTENIYTPAKFNGETCHMFDDILRTGGTIIGAGEAFRKVGAGDIHLHFSHGICCDDENGINAIEKIMNAEVDGKRVFASVSLTETHPNAIEAFEKYPDFVTLHKIAPVFDKLLFG